MVKLKSTDPNFDAAEIEDCYRALTNSDGDAHYEHGQWWIIDIYSGRSFSVVDADGDPSRVCGGFGFEEV